MIVLDYNIPEDQTKHLRRWRVHFRQIGFEVGRTEWDDHREILRCLHRAKHVTFLTRDLGFFRRRLFHSSYWLVVRPVPRLETALHIRRLPRNPTLKTMAERQGKAVWQAGQERLICHGL